MGVLEGAKVALDGLNNESDVTFFIDSQAAIKALSRMIIKSRLVYETVEALNQLHSKVRVTLRWIRAHEGHEANEEVDRLAKVATELKPERHFPVPFSNVKKMLREKTNARWQSDWESLELKKIPTGRAESASLTWTWRDQGNCFTAAKKCTVRSYGF